MIETKKPCCSTICHTLAELSENFGNVKKMYEIVNSLSASSAKSGPNDSKSDSLLCWDTAKFGTGITIS